MKTIEITGTKRTEKGKAALRKLRATQHVPCNLYGGKEQFQFTAPVLSFRHLVYTPAVQTVKLNVDGSSYNAIMQEIQFHPVTDAIMHIDFREYADDKEVVIDIPVHPKGTAEGVREGGRLWQKMRMVKIKALPKDLPDDIEINVEKMQIGNSVRVRDLKRDGVTFLDMPNNIVVAVKVTREVVEETPVVAAPVAGAPGAPAVPGAPGAPAAPGTPAAAGAAPAAGTPAAAPAADTKAAPEKGKKKK